MAMSFSRPDPASPAQIADASFPTSRRGFDQNEVRDFLRMVSAELGRLRERETFLERELRDARNNPDLDGSRLDDEALTRLLGEETARVLNAARESSHEIREKAEQSAARMLLEASDEATRMREEAEIEASRRRSDAAADAEAELSMAKQQGREMVNEARAYRERVLSELARRRELAREQIEQLIHGRDRLMQAFERARLVAVDVVSEMQPLGEPDEYVNLQPSTGPVPVMVARNDAPRGPGANAQEPTVEDTAEDTDDTTVEDSSDDASVRILSSVDMSTDDSRPGDSDHAADARVDVLDSHGSHADGDGSADPVDPAEPATDVPPTAESATDDVEMELVESDESESDEVESDLVDSDDVEMELVATDDIETDQVETDQAEEMQVDAGPEDAGFSEPNAVAPSGADGRDDDSDRHEVFATAAPTADDTTSRSNESADDDSDHVVVDLFARLRANANAETAARSSLADADADAGVFADVADGRVATDQSDESDASDVDADTSAEIEETLFERRDADLTPLIVSSARKLKRVLADEQNEVLDALRRSDPVRNLDAILPWAAHHAERYSSVIADDLLLAANAGASLADLERTPKLRKAAGQQAVSEASQKVAQWLVQPLRDRLERCVADGDGDNAAITQKIRAVYRECKTRHIDEQLDDVVRVAHGRGLLGALELDTPVEWTPDPSHDVCADCDDNRLAGVVASGQPFPTGQVCTPAHPGCRCMLVPVAR
ncbi:DivIVA domain-containing protein [Ilumatobacter sp.]|uniref:DivIVA domain-containing protein n=1 Tax=Ilumatobacter sp. TaxID=1967498 RepID=UPI003299C4A7